jgi:aryl-alcohol dehydrogenase-like predicted oxidoreductase
MTVPLRSLGTPGLAVSALGLGCVGMSEMYGPREPAESVATIQRALDLGITFLDTSDVYGLGHNEQFLGTALGSRRDEAVLATKFGAIRLADGSGYRVDGRPEYVVEACEASLTRARHR